MVSTSFDYVSQSPDKGGVKGAEGHNPLAAQLLGAPMMGEKGGALAQTLEKANEATAQLLSPDAKLAALHTPKDEGTQKAAEAAAVGAGLTPGKQVLDSSKQVASDTNFDPSTIMQKADQNFFSNVEKKNAA